MESRIAGGGLDFVHFSNFIYVTYCDLACFRHFLWLVQDGIRLFVGGCRIFRGGCR